MKSLLLVSAIFLGSALYPEQPQGRFFCTLAFPIVPGEVRQEELDCTPFAFPLRPIEYPKDLKGSGVVGCVGLAVFIAEDGSPKDWGVTGGNEIRFMGPVQRVVEAWRFSIPRKNGKAVHTCVDYTIYISEKEPVRVEFAKTKQNKAPEPRTHDGQRS